MNRSAPGKPKPGRVCSAGRTGRPDCPQCTAPAVQPSSIEATLNPVPTPSESNATRRPTTEIRMTNGTLCVWVLMDESPARRRQSPWGHHPALPTHHPSLSRVEPDGAKSRISVVSSVSSTISRPSATPSTKANEQVRSKCAARDVVLAGGPHHAVAATFRPDPGAGTEHDGVPPDSPQRRLRSSGWERVLNGM